MEGSRGSERRPWPPSGKRRAVALLALGAAGAAAVILLGGGGSDGADEDSRGANGLQESELAAGLSREQLVDQVLLLGFEGSDESSPFLSEVRERQLGGILVGPQNWLDAGQGAALIDTLFAAARKGGEIAPLIVGSQEGGRYRSFADLPPEETELEIAETGGVAATERWSESSASALAEAGFDLNLFPVADVATLDSPIADRAFSDDPVVAAQLTAAAVRGCRRTGLACAPLHFPGLGAASQDTNRGPATVSLDPAGLSGRDLEPFRAAFAEGVPAIVLSLAFYAAYDPVTPGALTESVATGLLRDELAFEGVAITDDLGAGAVRSGYAVPQAAVEALAAGADMIQIAAPENQAGVREAILEALADGRLEEARLAEAAGRVLALKRTQGLIG